MTSLSPAEIARRLLDSFDATRSLLSTDVVFELWQMVNESKRQDPARSLEIAEVAMAAAVHIDEQKATALAHWSKGQALVHLYRPADALTHYRQAETLFIQLNLPLETVRVQTPIIYTLNATGDPSAALELATEARQRAQKLGNDGLSTLASIEMNIGTIFQNQGNFEEALAACARATSACEQLGNKIDMARININRANVFREMDDLVNVEAAYLEARSVLESSQSHAQDLALVDENLGELAVQLGQYQLGLHRFENAYRGYQSEIRRASVNLQRAKVYTRLNLGREAIPLADAAYKMFVANDLKSQQADALIVLFDGYRQLGNREEAEALGIDALQRYRELARHYNAAKSELALARLYLDQGRLDEAQQLAYNVQSGSDPSLWPGLAAGSGLLLTNVTLQAVPASDSSHLAECQQALDQVLSLTRRFTLTAETIEAHHLQAQLCARRGDDAAAWRAFQQALTLINGLRMNLLLDEFQIGFMDQHLPVYIDALMLLSRHLTGGGTGGDMGGGVAVNNVSESTTLARMVSLLNEIGKLPTSSSGNNLDSSLQEADVDTLWAELRRLRREWLWRQEKENMFLQESVLLIESEPAEMEASDLSSSADQESVTTQAAAQTLNEIRAERVDLEEEMTDIWRRLGVQKTVGAVVDAASSRTRNGSLHHSHKLSELGGPDDAAEALVRSIQNQLTDISALLHYFLLGEQIFVLVLRPDRAKLFRLGTAHGVERALRVWRHHLQDHALIVESPEVANQTVKRPLGLLHRLLVEPLLTDLQAVEELYLVLPPIWHELPFSAFWGPIHAQGTASTAPENDYLIKRFQLTRLSYPEALIGHMRQAAEPTLQAEEDAQTLVIGYSSNGALPRNVKEAQQIGARLGASTTCHLYTEEEANAERFFATAPHCRLIHLATHALFRPESPLFSSLELTDHLLTVAEIYHSVRLHHQPLVVFSACETGRGDPHDGGLLGMARALIGAGAGDLILTLWQIEDTQSENLMARFYDHIFSPNLSSTDASLTSSTISSSTTPMSHSLALHQAQLALTDTLHPFFWAGFIYIGG